MALNYYPRTGEVLLCNYATGFIPPEMVKLRPVVIISPRLRRRGNIVTVVPLSTTPPAEPYDYCYKFSLGKPLPPPFDAVDQWAKCDMVAAVALARLDRFRDGRTVAGARRFTTGQVDGVQLRGIRQAVLFGLGLGTLTISV